MNSTKDIAAMLGFDNARIVSAASLSSCLSHEARVDGPTAHVPLYALALFGRFCKFREQ